MKKLILLLLMFCKFTDSSCQNIDNPSFDSVFIGGIDRIYSWITSDAWPVTLGDTVHPMNPNDHYITTGLQYHETYYSVQLEYSSPFHGSNAIKLLSEIGRVDILGNPFRGFVLNGNHFYTDNNGYIDLSKGGTPFTYRPYKLIGHYKLVDNSTSLHNYPEAYVLLKKYNSITLTTDTIGYAIADVQFFPTGTWLPFEIPINYLSNQTPDSIVVAFFSPALGASSTLWVDSLGFDYNFPSEVPQLPNKTIDFYLNQQENKIHFSNIEDFTSVKIYDLTGQLILTIEKPVSIIDISDLSQGTYLMSVTYKNKSVQNHKFILQ